MTHLTFSQIELSWTGGGGGRTGTCAGLTDSRGGWVECLDRGFAGYLEEDGSAWGVLATGVHRN